MILKIFHWVLTQRTHHMYRCSISSLHYNWKGGFSLSWCQFKVWPRNGCMRAARGFHLTWSSLFLMEKDYHSDPAICVKYAHLDHSLIFTPIAIETSGVFVERILFLVHVFLVQVQSIVSNYRGQTAKHTPYCFIFSAWAPSILLLVLFHIASCVLYLDNTCSPLFC